MVEYLAVAMAIITAILALSHLVNDPANGMAIRLLDKVDHQLRRTSGTADNLLQ